MHAKFARLTQQEEKHGLLDDSSAIGTREGWSSRLAERGFALKGHRLVKVNAQETAKFIINVRSITSTNQIFVWRESEYALVGRESSIDGQG